MTKKHFIKIANTLREEREKVKGKKGQEMVDNIARSLAATFSEINPRFNYSTFYQVVGIE